MIGLMDCNNFFVSCERLFRPDLAKKPVLVLSSNDGCVVARSQEVKDLGVLMGEPYFKMRGLCEKEGITVFSSNFSLYRDVSRRVMHALRQHFGDIQVYSIDEAFFEVGSLTEEAIVHIRAEIMRTTGIPVSFGVADTKTIAKIAGTYAKKGYGVQILTTKSLHERAGEIACGSIWGVGRKTAQKLNACGIYTLADFLKHDMRFYENNFGILGTRLYHELTGIRAESVHDNELHGSYTSTRSFGVAVTDCATIESAIGYHVSHVGEKLRHDEVLAKRITVVCAPSRYDTEVYKDTVLTTSLEEPTNDTAVLLHESLKLFHQVFKSGIRYKKAGVVCSDIIPQGFESISLFEVKNNKDRVVYDIVDSINARQGSGTLRPGVVLHTEKWESSHLKQSPAYTTKWSDIAHCKADQSHVSDMALMSL